MNRRSACDLKYFVILSSLVCLSRAFNIDVSKANVIGGAAGKGFGTAVEFFKRSSGSTIVLVGDPYHTATERDESGRHFVCSPQLSGAQACDVMDSPPQPWDYTPGQCARYRPPPGNDHIFGERQELFGQTMAVLNETAVLVCGPMWSDLCYWELNFIFNIGRCTVISGAPDTIGFTPYREDALKNYQKNIQLPGNPVPQKDMYYGRAEFGFSASADEKGRAVIGSPGFSVSRGGIAVFYTGNTSFVLSDTPMSDPEPETYFGYSVAAGNFCGQDRFCFAVSDRTVFGRVTLVEAAGASFQILTRLNGTQEYAAFGYSLCAADVNGDGWSDLLVGAPLHTVSTNDSKSEDEGRVYVFLSRGEVKRGHESFNLSLTLEGDHVSFARFGSAITSIGDINRDSYLDVAIGAPYEDKGTGAVYVYLGGPQGIVPGYTQKITGKDFDPPLSSFGFYISKPTTALSEYNYPDFAVGCPESNKVALLRTQLIVNAEVSIRADPNPVFPSNPCPQIENLGSVRASGCFDIELYFTQNSESEYAESLDLDYTLDIDTLVGSDTLKRARLAVLSGRIVTSTTTSISETVTVRNTKPERVVHIAILKEEQINRNRFTPVQVHVQFALNTSRFTGIVPVLNRSISTSAQEEVTFKNQCGEDEKCQADLVLDGRVHHAHEYKDLANINVVNATRRVDMHLQLSNRGEMSYGVRLVTNITGLIAFKTAVDSTRAHFLCEPQANTTSADGVVTGSVLVCSNWAPMATNTTVDVVLQFEATSVPLDPRYSDVMFQVTAMPYSPKENPEGDPSNNYLQQTSPLRIVSNLGIGGEALPPTIHVRRTAGGEDLEIQHQVFLRNDGPSFLPPTHVNVSIPQRSSAGKDLLKNDAAHNVTIQYEDGTKVKCDLIVSMGSATGGTNTPAPTTSTEATTTSKEDKMTTTTTVETPVSSSTEMEDLSTTTNPFGPVRPSKRKRRAAESSPQKDKSSLDGSNKRWFRMDCESYRCLVYQCALPAIQPGGTPEINIALAVSRAALPFSDIVDTLLLVTRTEVAQPDHPLFFAWTTPREIELQTSIIEFKTGGEEINIWIIVGGVLGGLLLLLILGLVFWKLGCFRRKNRDKLEALKRQSGFYNNSTRKSTKSRTSSSGSSTKRKSELE